MVICRGDSRPHCGSHRHHRPVLSPPNLQLRQYRTTQRSINTLQHFPPPNTDSKPGNVCNFSYTTSCRLNTLVCTKAETMLLWRQTTVSTDAQVQPSHEESRLLFHKTCTHIKHTKEQLGKDLSFERYQVHRIPSEKRDTFISIPGDVFSFSSQQQKDNTS